MHFCKWLNVMVVWTFSLQRLTFTFDLPDLEEMNIVDDDDQYQRQYDEFGNALEIPQDGADVSPELSNAFIKYFKVRTQQENNKIDYDHENDKGGNMWDYQGQHEAEINHPELVTELDIQQDRSTYDRHLYQNLDENELHPDHWSDLANINALTSNDGALIYKEASEPLDDGMSVGSMGDDDEQYNTNLEDDIQANIDKLEEINRDAYEDGNTDESNDTFNLPFPLQNSQSVKTNNVPFRVSRSVNIRSIGNVNRRIDRNKNNIRRLKALLIHLTPFRHVRMVSQYSVKTRPRFTTTRRHVQGQLKSYRRNPATFRQGSRPPIHIHRYLPIPVPHKWSMIDPIASHLIG